MVIIFHVSLWEVFKVKICASNSSFVCHMSCLCELFDIIRLRLRYGTKCGV
jgi:hypothetical protein